MAKETVHFDYELPSGDVLEVEAAIDPGYKGRAPNLAGAGEPGQGAFVVLLSYGPLDLDPGESTDLDGLWLSAGKGIYKGITADIEQMALDVYERRKG